MGAEAAAARERMVRRQLARRGIEGERVLEAMGSVPRELFVPEELAGRAYADAALPIGCGQTISQPWIVAAICQALALEGDELVLEIGTGSGYSTAVLARLADRVISIERVPELVERARRTLGQLDLGAEVIEADGSLGLPSRAPFDAIAVHAAVPEDPRTLLEQLGPSGRLVAPVAHGHNEDLVLFRRTEGGFSRSPIAPCRFVPLIGAEGYRSD